MRAYNPPFIKATLTDPYYRLLMNDEARFWSVCMRNKPAGHFSNDFKDLIRLMLSFNPDQRPSIADIRQAAWMAGPVTGPLAVAQEPNAKKVPASRAAGNQINDRSKVQASCKMYRSAFNMKTSSIFNEDYIIEQISCDELALLRYSRIVTVLEPNNTVSCLSQFFESLQASYSPITPELKVKVLVPERENDGGLEFKVNFYRFEDKIVIYLIKRKGDEFGFIDKFEMLSEIVREHEELVLSELVS